MGVICAIYSRKSRFTGKGESIENQIELCRQYICLHLGKEAEGTLVYEDEGFSGGTLDRPQFKRMMEDARAGKFSVLVCYRLDRISRSIGDFAGLIQELHDLGISFLSIKEQFDTQSPMGRAMMYIASVFSQLERETIAERIRDNMHELAKTGRWLGGVTPTGYASEAVERVTVDGKVRRSCKLKVIPQEAQLVGLIFQTFLRTGSLTGTDAYLLQRGCLSKNGKPFTRFTIKGILTNPVYMTADADALEYFRRQGAELFARAEEFDGAHGIAVYNRTIQRRGKAHQNREMEDWIIAVGGHEGLISGADWVRVQRLLERGRLRGSRKPRSQVALLSGLLRCGQCGDYMRPKLTQRKNNRGEPVYAYLCTTKERSRGQCCAMRNADGNQLDRIVWKTLSALSEDGGELCLRLEEEKKGLGSGEKRRSEELRRWKEEREKRGLKLEGLISALGRAAGTSAEGYLVEKIEAIHPNIKEADRRIALLEQEENGEELSQAELEELGRTLARLDGAMERLSPAQKRETAGLLVSKVVWNGEKACIFLHGSDGETPVPLGEYRK
ncbi:MAG: recombinase family protein [Lawsonibacter sp.]